MKASLQELAERMREEVNSGAIEWTSILLGPRFAQGNLMDEFNKRLEGDRANYLEDLVGWDEDRLRVVAAGESIPTPLELATWAEEFDIEPDWILSAPLSDASGHCGWVLFIQNVSYCDGGPLFEVIKTFADEQAADQYLNENWPELQC